MHIKRFVTALTLIGLMFASGACSPASPAVPDQPAAAVIAPQATESGAMSPTAAEPAMAPQLAGSIAVDGSSTVFPITEATAEEFGMQYPDVRVAVGLSGTGGGFKKFCSGETDISDASRPIKDEEVAVCEAAGIAYTPLSIGLDGIRVVVNPANTWATCLTVEQLKSIWDAGSTISSWSEVDPSYPDKPLKLYAPGTDSGTFDFFTEEINGTAKQSRPDFTASEDDNVLVQGIAGDEGGLGYFGLAYFLENQDKLHDVAVDGGQGCVNASQATVEDGAYTPLSRPLFLYVNNEAFGRPEVYEFVKYYLENATELVPAVGYVAIDQSVYDQGLATIERFKP